MNLHFGLKQAKAEIVHLNVEIRHLLTFMYDDHVNHYNTIWHHIITDLPLAHELSLQWEYHNAIHEKIFWRLQQTAKLDRFSGLLVPGRHVGHSQDEPLDMPTLPLWLQQLCVQHGQDVDSDGWRDEDEELHADSDEDIDGLVQFMDDLAT